MIAAALRAGPRALVSFAAERPGAAIAGLRLRRSSRWRPFSRR